MKAGEQYGNRNADDCQACSLHLSAVYWITAARTRFPRTNDAANVDMVKRKPVTDH
ncbi:hypothetical protein BCR43DRAFT_519367 [Syncephalastrum racemosum]|uniref:Uncharacterized protein n=1 Tax=Syncephalastrum racemosum TaxID=13706 RepID=A0A1X2GZ09_SYNRA|nr:hypothetical protein BCR43DRAFT_519367 [Syncephalastrum racemosum]